MAALKNHGTEIARLTTEQKLGTETTYTVHYSFRSDGHIMRRLIAQNIHDTTYGASPHHDYGWKLYKKLKKDSTLSMETVAQNWRDTALAGGTYRDWKES